MTSYKLKQLLVRQSPNHSCKTEKTNQKAEKTLSQVITRLHIYNTTRHNIKRVDETSCRTEKIEV